MKLWFKRKRQPAHVGIPTAVEVALDQVREAVQHYEAEMPQGVTRLSLLLPDGSLDMKRLSRYLGGISDQKFYLSKETYEIFNEAARQIPYYLDMVQAAVDNYMEEQGKLPLVKGSPQYEVDFRLLMREHYLRELPPFPLYMTNEEFMLTHKPSKVN